MKFKWNGLEQKAFDDIKCAVYQDTLLAYPYFNRRFDIHMDSSNYQLGALIRQNGKPIAFYSQKLTGLQTWYTVTEKEFLIIVKTLKGFCMILLGQK